ncbi:MAG TPA: peroxide stress protein YaaA [Clostridiales bacterium]|nr:peroxide stress protein YaaA [Clostridiales bacterium]
MRIIISPAKKMNMDTDSLPYETMPLFLDEAETLLCCLRGMSYAELKALWRCNDSIAALNFERMQGMDLRRNLTPAILSFEGIQYQYMGPGVFEYSQYDYIKEHLRILSGFYGLLRPFDGVAPYRLEMQAKLSVGNKKDLYAFWGDKLARQLSSETNFILNLASVEYSKAVLPYLSDKVRCITCIFGEQKGDKIIEKGTLCKMARGDMVRWLAENHIVDPERIKEYNRLEYTYCDELSDCENFVFLKKQTINCAIR